MPSSLPVLMVDDEQEALMMCEVMLGLAGLRDFATCSDSREVMEILAARPFGVVLLDLRMPHVSGEELLPLIRQEHPELPVIILTGANDVETAVRCMQAGAFDYMVKPVEDSRFVSGVRRALELRALQAENTKLTQSMQSHTLEHPEAFQEIVTRSPVMFSVLRYAETVAETGKPVLITGDTGTGKEPMARAIHVLSGRPGPLLAINVGGLDDNVFSDTLFGHQRGAFTGADTVRRGLIEQAADGTLFLDEIGDLCMASQVKLLRLLQENEYLPLGADIPKRSQTRIIAATNQDLKNLQETGAFRKDLYFRLQTHHVHIPLLTERRDDLPVLLEHFIEKAAVSLGKKKPTAPPEIAILLSTYAFPGNVRELEGLVFEAVSHHRSGMLSMDVFRAYIESHTEVSPDARLSPTAPDTNELAFGVIGRFPTLREADAYLIEEALRRAQGNQSIAASLLGISRSALNKRLNKTEET